MTTEQELHRAKRLLTQVLECNNICDGCIEEIKEFLGISPDPDPMHDLPNCEPDQVNR